MTIPDSLHSVLEIGERGDLFYNLSRFIKDSMLYNDTHMIVRSFDLELT